MRMGLTAVFVSLFIASSALAQTGVAPRRPAGTGARTTAVASLAHDLRGRSSPYYNDSPLFVPQAGAVWPMLRLQPQPATAQPVPTNQVPLSTWTPSPSPLQPTAMPVTTAPVAQPSATPLPAAASVRVPPSPLTNPPAPTTGQAAAPANTPAPAPNPSPAAAPANPALAAANSAAPFVDQTVFLPARQEWREYDLTPYTAKFPPSARAEEAVRQWIFRQTGAETWHGVDVASLAVSPNRIRVYHGPQTQEQVARLLGRFLYYVPGQFRSRVRVWSVKDSDWRSRSAVALQSVGKGAAAGKVWLIGPADANLLAQHLSHRSNGSLLAEPEFLVANGQTAQVRWSEEGATGAAAPAATEPEGIAIRFSPLIAEDAVSLDVDLHGVARRRQEKGTKRIGHYGATPAIVPVDVAETKTQVHLPPGRQILVSLGLFPELPEQKRLLGKVKKQELVALIEIVPEGANTIAGAPIAASPLTAMERNDRRTVAKPSRGWEAPPELTRPVF